MLEQSILNGKLVQDRHLKMTGSNLLSADDNQDSCYECSGCERLGSVPPGLVLSGYSHSRTGKHVMMKNGSTGSGNCTENNSGLGQLIGKLRDELLQLVKRDDELLFQLQGIDRSICGLKDILQGQDVTSHCKCCVHIRNSSEVESPDEGSEHPEPNKTADVNLLWDIVDDQQTASKIGNRVFAPIARVISWLGDSDFEKAASKERDQFDDDLICRLRSRSRTCSDLSSLGYLAVANKRVAIPKYLPIAVGHNSDNISFLGGNAPYASAIYDIDNEFQKMWRSETSLTSDAPFHWSRSSPAWRSFSMLDKLDNYLLNQVSTRVRFQPRPRLHRQSSVTDSFEVSFDGGSAKIFLSERQFPPSNSTEVVIPVTLKRENVSENVEKTESVSEHLKSDSGFDDSFEEIEKDSGISGRPKKIVGNCENVISDVNVNVSQTLSNTDNCSSENCDAELVSEPLESGETVHGSSEVELDKEVSNIQDSENFITFHDGVVACRIMSPNLERQISEQNDQTDDFQFLTIVDGKVVFRSRESVEETDEESYHIDELFGELTDTCTDSTDGDSYCTAVTDFSDQRDFQHIDRDQSENV